MNSQEYYLNIRPGVGYSQTVKVSQNDVGRPLVFHLLDGTEQLRPAAGTTVTIHGTKPSGLGFTETCTLTGAAASIDTTLTMTQEAGSFPAELVLTLGTDIIGTANFMLNVERSPHDENTIDGTMDVADSIFERMDDLEDELDEVKEDIAQLGGLSDDVKTALLQLAQKVAYIDDDGQTYYQDLYDALYPPAPPATLVSISAVYTQSGTVYDTDTLDSLKTDLVVTALYDDQTTEAVTTYTLSGTLTAGTSTITVSYGGKTTTFNVTVTSNTPLYPFENGTHTFTTYPQVVTVTNGNTAEVTLAQYNNKDVHANVSDVTANTTSHGSTDNYLNNNTKWFTIHSGDTVRMKGTVNSVVKASDATKAAIVLRDMSKTNVFSFMVDVLLKDLTENQVIEYSDTFESDTDIACLGWYMGARGNTSEAKLSMTFELYVNDVRYV